MSAAFQLHGVAADTRDLDHDQIAMRPEVMPGDR
jgi:hypothetical protein